MKLFTPKNNKYFAGISAVLVGASQITTPIDLKSMIPSWVTNPFIGTISILGIAAYGAVIGGVLVLLSRTD